MRIHFVVHETYEAPGAYETWVKARNHRASYSRVYDNEPLPESIDGFDMLVVMGGPQSPATTLQECAHFDSKAEQILIARCVTAGKAVVGVCLGAQLLGEALGAQCEHSPEKEIGNHLISLTADGQLNDKFSHFGDTLEVGHWHSDMPGLTKNSKIIAYSEGCPRQIIEYGELAYGFQCHMELTPSLVELLIKASEGEFERLTMHRFVQSPQKLRKNHYDNMNQMLFGFLDKLVLSHARHVL